MKPGNDWRGADSAGPPLFLGIDIGTTGVRSAVVDREGGVVATARTAHRPQEPGREDARLWWDAARDCVQEQMARLALLGNEAARVAHVAVDGTSGTVVLANADLEPVTRALSYNVGGFAAEAERIARLAPETHIARGAESALARALRLQDEDVEGRAAHLLHQADYIAARLVGRGGHSDVMNALKTGIDPETATWPNWVAELVSPHLLPEAHMLGMPLGTIQPSVAEDLGLPKRARVHAGTTDSIAAFLAAADMEAGVAVTSLGSTLAVKLLSPLRVEDPAKGVYSHRVGAAWMAGGASNTGGRVLRKHFSDARLAELGARIDPERDPGLDYYPLLEPGERFPVRDPDLAPRLTPRPDDDALFLHGILDGIARIEARCYQALEEAGAGRPRRIHTAGGGAASEVFTAIRARRLGMMPLPAQHAEAAAGVALAPLHWQRSQQARNAAASSSG